MGGDVEQHPGAAAVFFSLLRRVRRGELTFDAEGIVREIWHVDDDLQRAGLYHPVPYVDSLIPLFYLSDQTPEELLEHCAWREAYLARYGRIPPSEIRDLDTEHVTRLLLKVSELVCEEYKARAGANPLDPTTEDAAG